jgi:cytochrome oxidase Cu insertion factor (SCO1/SenC/PrrC family)
VPGMNSGLNPADPTLVAAFRSALVHQGAIALIIIAFLGLLWATARTWRLTTPTATPVADGAGQASGADADAGSDIGTGAGAGPSAAGGADTGSDTGTSAGAGPGAAAGAGPGAAGGAGTGGAGSTGRRRGQPEARARALLRIGFGVIWIFDGILQAQPKMAGGLASQVIEPTAAASPAWVQHVVNWGGTIWSYHPITAGAASVWIQIGIGAWMLVAARGTWSRLAGVAWGLTVWMFGESFGGIFAPGLSWLTGAPGAVLIYVVAGALIALPEDAWRSPKLGRLLLGGIGIFFIGMAVLQAWPGRGFWKGTINGQPGTLAGMVQTMSSTSQPHFLSALLARFGSFAASNGFAVNLVVVIVLAAMGVIFLTGKAWLVRYAVWFGIAFGLAVWVLVQDLGFLGGLGTDPNSMIPLMLLYSSGYLALTPAPEAAPAAEAADEEPGWRLRLRPKALGSAFATASAWSVAAVAAVAVVLIGAVPMAAAAVNRTADPILAEAIEGGSITLNLPAPGFQLTDQNGHTVTLASLRGKVVLMTFLDPVCTTDCPIIGQEMREAGVLLGPADKDVELVAVVANPTYRAVAFTRAFDRQEGFNTVPNWLYLTGSLSQLGQVWRQYGVTVSDLPAGAMTAHSEEVVVIDRSGIERQVTDADPGPATSSTRSSFSVMISGFARQALSSP